MYLSFYNLRSKPFPEKTAPDRLWLNEKTKKALAVFREGIIANKGIMILTGDVGTGKTSFINSLINSFSDNIVVANVVNPALNPQGFLHVLADIFHLPKVTAGQDEILSSLQNFLIDVAADGKKVLLIVDEAQRLSNELLQLILRLADLQDKVSKLLNIILVAQNDFNSVLFKPGNSDLRKKVEITHNIVPLTKAETAQYIKHHLRMAGGSEDIFSSEAMDAVFSATGGSPRLINLICDLALLSGFTSETAVISKEIVSRCKTKLMLPQDKIAQSPPVAVHKTEKIGEHPFGRQRKTGWRKSSYGLLLLFILVLILFGARQLLNKKGVADDMETTSVQPQLNETIITPAAVGPSPSQKGSPAVPTQPSGPTVEQTAISQSAPAVPSGPVTPREGTERTVKEIQVAAAEDAPVDIYEQPRQSVEQATERVREPELLEAEKPAAVLTQPSGPTAEQTAISQSAPAVLSGAVTPREGTERTVKEIQVAAAEAAPAKSNDQSWQPVEQATERVIKPQPPETEKPAAGPASESAHTEGKRSQTATAPNANGSKEKSATKTSPDSPVISQEKPLPEKIEVPLEIPLNGDLRNGTKMVLTVYFGNLRDGPGMEANIIGVAKQGDIVTDLLKKGKWHFVKLDDGRLGWMHQSLFAPLQKIAIEKVEEPAVPSETGRPATNPQTDRESRITIRPRAEKKIQPHNIETTVPAVVKTSPAQTAPPPAPAVAVPIRSARETTSTSATSSASEIPLEKTASPTALEWTQKSFESVSQGRFTQGIDEATKAIGLDPGLVNPYINRAWAYCEIGLYEKAIADCQTALTIEPQNALAFNNLGLAYHRMTQLATARQYYQKACDLKLAVACRNYRLLLSE